MRPTADVTVAAWAAGTRSVYERGGARARDLLAASARRGGRTETIRIENTHSRGFYAYPEEECRSTRAPQRMR